MEASEAAAKTRQNINAEKDQTILLVKEFIHEVTEDIKNVLKGKEAQLYYKMDDLKKHERLSRYPWLAKEIEGEHPATTKTIISEFGKLVVSTLENLGYKVELTSYNLTISWAYLI